MEVLLMIIAVPIFVLGVVVPIIANTLKLSGRDAQIEKEAPHIRHKGKNRRRRELVLFIVINSLLLAGSVGAAGVCIAVLTDGNNEYNMDTGEPQEGLYFNGVLACGVIFCLTLYWMWILIHKYLAVKDVT